MAYTLQNPAPSKGDPTAKNRVWDFFGESSKSRPKNRPQSQQPHRKNRPCSYKTASGIPYWPSRDPIGERGGVNLYGFVRNDGVNRLDYFGLQELRLPDDLLDLPEDKDILGLPDDLLDLAPEPPFIKGVSIASVSIFQPMRPTKDAPAGTLCPDITGNGIAWGTARITLGLHGYESHTSRATGGQFADRIGEDAVNLEGESVVELATQLAIAEIWMLKISKMECCEIDPDRKREKDVFERVTWENVGVIFHEEIP